jgi:hypothetical protein
MSPSLESEFKKAADRYTKNQRQGLIDRIRLPVAVLGRAVTHLKATPPKHLLGYGLAITGLLYLAKPEAFRNFGLGLTTVLLHKPTPTTQPSPWPWRDQEDLHPLIKNLPADAERSIDSVAAYIAAREQDPYRQVKALHDYVIKRVSYDMNVLRTGARPPQDAKTVFQTRRGVCEGYANLFTALAKSMGLEVATIEGNIRRDLAPIDDIAPWQRAQDATYDWTLHAWNAVKVNGQWQLVDTTWDDLGEGSSAANYRAAYLMPSPAMMIASHRPTQPAWQLLARRKSKQEFENQPLLKPEFFREGLVLIAPKMQQTTVGAEALIRIQQPREQRRQQGGNLGALFITKADDSVWTAWGSLLQAAAKKNQQPGICTSEQEPMGSQLITCRFPAPGSYKVLLFSAQITPKAEKPKITDLGLLSFKAR